MKREELFMENNDFFNEEVKEVTFFKFWKTLFFSPSKFFMDHLEQGSHNPLYFYIAFIVLSVGGGVEHMNKLLMKNDLKGTFELVEKYNNWTSFLLWAVVGGLVGGILKYLLGGWFVNLRIRFSGGSKDKHKSRMIYIFSEVIFNCVVILATIVSIFVKVTPMEQEPFASFDLMVFFISLSFMFYSVYVSYRGVVTITDVNRTKAKFWFLVVPVVYILFAFSTVFAFVFNLK